MQDSSCKRSSRRSSTSSRCRIHSWDRSAPRAPSCWSSNSRGACRWRRSRGSWRRRRGTPGCPGSSTARPSGSRRSSPGSTRSWGSAAGPGWRPRAWRRTTSSAHPRHLLQSHNSERQPGPASETDRRRRDVIQHQRLVGLPEVKQRSTSPMEKSSSDAGDWAPILLELELEPWRPIRRGALPAGSPIPL